VAWSNTKELWLAVSKYRPSPNELYSLTTTCHTPDQSTASSSDPRLFHTDSLLPGSFTVANCSSLYFLNAGPRLCESCGSLFVSALMSERCPSVWDATEPSKEEGIPSTTFCSCKRISVSLIHTVNVIEILPLQEEQLLRKKR